MSDEIYMSAKKHPAIIKAEKAKLEIIQSALDKAKSKYDEHESSFNSTGYDRYWNLMQKYEAEVDELEKYIDEDILCKRERDRYKSRFKEKEAQLKKVQQDLKNLMVYLKAEIPDCTELRQLDNYIEHKIIDDGSWRYD